MSQLDLILSRLSGVKPAPNHNYQANCPCGTHSKINNGKLYLKDGGEIVLIDCKSGCTVSEVLYELEMRLCDLYPPRTKEDDTAWRKKEVVRAIARKKDDDAIKLWTELCVITETLQHRIFNNESHPANKSELWQREKEAVRLLPTRFKAYYS